jgi:hypothetical protein
VHHCLQRLVNTPKDKDLEFTTSTDVKIILVGMPEDVVLDNLFKCGALKYESYCRFMSQKHFIPIDDFNEECELSLKDINGVKELPEGEGENGESAASSSSSSSSASSSKSSSSSSKKGSSSSKSKTKSKSKT